MKVGDYVRLPDGIHKIKEYEYRPEYENCHCMYLDDNDYGLLFTDKELIKHSPNIIDLIEENDFINGLRVEKNKYGELYTSYVYYGGDIGKQCEVYTTWLEEYKENEDYIDSILTKEQFETMEYKVKE